MVDAGTVIRDVRPDELEEVGDLTVRAFREYRPLVTPAFVEVYEEDIRDVGRHLPHASVLVADLGGRIAGTITLLPDGSGSGVHGFPVPWPVLRMLAVDPAARGQGIGRLLVAACLERARALGAPVLGLHTAPFMAAARALYEALGFERVPEFDVASPGSPTALAYRIRF
ncbi:MAG TPA: GNAT family N-acetyltransferase [Actinomycetota bacterium]|nr:GNAT family N-acetyltransferase [Actinomycetota bacterium]